MSVSQPTSVSFQRKLLAALPAIITIGVLCLTWVLMGEIIQNLQDGWSKPWFITYTIHSGYSIMLIPWAYLRYRRTGAVMCWRCKRRQSVHLQEAKPAEVNPFPVSDKQLFLLALVIQAWACAVGFAWYLSLPETLVAANNAIYQSASAFVFIISIFALGEIVTLPKIAAVIVCVGGVCMVSFAPSSSTDSGIHQTIGGYIWVIVSTALYSGYQVVYARYTEQRVTSLADLCRRRPPHPHKEHVEDTVLSPDTEALLTDFPQTTATHDDTPVALSPLLTAEIAGFMLGWMGVFTFLTLWPIFFIFNVSGVEPFAWPDHDKAVSLMISTVLDAVYNVALLFGIQITSPLWMSLGTVLVVPASIIADKVLHNAQLSGQAGGGIALIIIGFIILQVPLPKAWNKPITCRRAENSQ